MKKTNQFKMLTDKLDEQNIKYSTVELSDGKVCFIRKFTKSSIKKSFSLLQKDKIAAMFILLQDNWLGGNEDILKESDLFLEVIGTFDELLEVHPIEINKIENTFEVKIDGKSCILRKPTIGELGHLFNTLEKDVMQAVDLILENCWVSGDNEIKTNDEYALSLSPIVEQMLGSRSATLKKNWISIESTEEKTQI